MAQVYVALHDDTSNFLIARKRVQNQWWGGQAGAPAIVNQAGQWCLPGGRIEGAEPALAAARREFLEETGYDITALNGEALFSDHRYTVVDIDVSPAQLQQIAQTIEANLRPRVGDANRPAGAGVVDWELSGVRIVHANQIRAHLGVRLFTPLRQQINARPAHTQSIDWYAEIAVMLAER